ncbi:MAG: hypothetical protein R2789_11810 [Microthrixaceae bacterium]
MDELRSSIRAHDDTYYGADAPTIPDADYDDLVLELGCFEAEHPDLGHQTVHPPAGRRAGTHPFAPVKHSVPMMSLDADGLRRAQGLGRAHIEETRSRGKDLGGPLHMRTQDRRTTRCRYAGRTVCTCRRPPAATVEPART